jgi:hypothetical protein
VPREAHRIQSGVALIGAVRREQQTPVRGVGVEWLRCVSRYGYSDVREFLIQFLELAPAHLPDPPAEVLNSPVAAYNFRAENYYVPDLPSAGSDDESGEGPDDILRAVLDDGLAQVQFEMPVRLVSGETALHLVTHSVGARSLVVAKPAESTLADGMAIVHFPIPLRKETTWVRLLCSISAAPSGDDENGAFLELRIVEMLHERTPGIFERFVRYLHERTMPTKAAVE